MRTASGPDRETAALPWESTVKDAIQSLRYGSVEVPLAMTALLVLATSAMQAAPSPAEKPQEAPAPTPTPTPVPPRPPFVAGYRNGFTLQSETGDFVLKITGYVQSDGRFATGDDANAVTNAFLMRRVRPIVQGTVSKYFDFYLNPDFGGGLTILQDAYIDTRFTPKLRFRAGKLKTPFGIERLQSGQNLLFVERALPNNLVPNRDVGLQVHGELGQGGFGYQLAVLNGVPDGGFVDTGHQRFQGPRRARVLPALEDEGDLAAAGVGLRVRGHDREGHRLAASVHLGFSSAHLQLRRQRHRQRHPYPLVAAGFRRGGQLRQQREAEELLRALVRQVGRLATRRALQPARSR